MQTSVKKLKNSQVELSVTLDKDDLLGYVEEIERQLAAETSVEGFRPGKAPRDAIRNKFGEDKIRQEALSLSIEKSMALALARENMRPLEQSDFKIDENTAEKLAYHVTFTLFPDIKLGKYTDLDIHRKPVLVDEPEIDKIISDVQKMKVVTKEVARPAMQGDKLEIDFTVQLDGKVIEGGKSENHPLVIGQNSFAPGFEDQLMGLKAGEHKQFQLKMPVDYYQKTIAGKEVTIEVTVKKVEERAVPEINDEFAKTLGKFGTVDDLKASVKEGLTIEKETQEKDRLRLAILDKISETTECEVPTAMIEKQLDMFLQDFDNDLHRRGMELGLYLAQIKKSQDDLRTEWRAKAERQVKMSLITSAISQEEHIDVSEDEIEKEFSVLADQYAQAGKIESLKASDLSQIRSRLHNLILNEKVFNFLEKKNAVN